MNETILIKLQTSLSNEISLSSQLLSFTNKNLYANNGTKSEFVNRILLTRMAIDLRCIQSLALEGDYIMQAATIAAGDAELLRSIAIIGGFEDRAKSWLTHNDTKKSYPNYTTFKKPNSLKLEFIKGLTRASYNEKDATEFVGIWSEYLYPRLCQYKHSNIIAENEYILYMHIYNHEDSFTPQITDQLIQKWKFILLTSSLLLSHAYRIYSYHHATHETKYLNNQKVFDITLDITHALNGHISSPINTS